VNPFPATLGRICPHPCESGCNRSSKDGAVAINALERFLGDWGLEQRLGLPTVGDGRQPESIGVVGAGPAGLSFAYQMARRGYRVTVYEKQEKPGGMLCYGIPKFRLPEDVLDAEIRRVLALGVDLKLRTAIGRDVTLTELRERHAALFLGIGAGRGRRLDIPGEEGAGVWTGTRFLGALNRGEAVALGKAVVVVGGGNTAIDAARCARRTGAHVTLLYRRTSAEMPAIRSEVEAAAAEGVDIRYLAAPVRIERNAGVVQALIAQRTQLAEPDGSGRRRCVPLAASEFELRVDSVIAAVSQETDWSDFDDLGLDRAPGRSPRRAPLAAGVWAGGDALVPGIAGLAIAQGRQAAEAVHARLRGLVYPAPGAPGSAPSPAAVKADFYMPKERASAPSLNVDERLARPHAEVDQTLGEEAFLEEVTRCFSCGLCFGCEHCFTYCNAGGFTRLEQVQPGAYFALNLDRCEACRKCIEVCPCGFLSATSGSHADDPR
jgi:formate dehydrogenase major subunit